jgi:hypothetical protein
MVLSGSAYDEEQPHEGSDREGYEKLAHARTVEPLPVGIVTRYGLPI